MLHRSFSGLCNSSVRLSAPSGEMLQGDATHTTGSEIYAVLLARCRNNGGTDQGRLCCCCSTPILINFKGRAMPYSLPRYLKPLPHLGVPFPSGLVLHDEPNTALVGHRGSRATLAFKLALPSEAAVRTGPCWPCERSVHSLGFSKFSTTAAHRCIPQGSTDDKSSSVLRCGIRTKNTISCATVIKRSTQP